MGRSDGIPGSTGCSTDACRTLLQDCIKTLEVATGSDAQRKELIESIRYSLYRFNIWTVSISELYTTDSSKWVELDPLGLPRQPGIRQDLCKEVLRLLDQLQKLLRDRSYSIVLTNPNVTVPS